MKKNMGNLDRMLRLLVAAVIATLYFTGLITGTVAVVGLVLALVFSFTAVIGTCPLYLPFGINTKPKKD
ncbi:MAG: hypothetical protein RLZZ28_2235 [Bacteroidota bacterium]